MSLARTFLGVYRKLQNKVFGRSEYGIMSPGVLCTHTPFEEEINHGDVVHPCVRYIPEGYLGHKWWMVYTPYYASNDKTENPILCYGDNDTAEPPTHWIVAYQVQGQPSKGYNSDPTLFYDEGKLYVMWRENLTDRCENAGFSRATFGAEVLKDSIGKVFGPLVGTKELEEDAEVSPTFFKTSTGKYRCYAMHLRFHSPYIQKQHPIIRKLLTKAVAIMDLLGLWSQQKGFGYAIWESDDIKQPFDYLQTVRFDNCNRIYRPWHMDLLEYNDNLYAIVQSNQCNADICLAVSKDRVNFRFFDKPLMTNDTCKKIGIYKPTAGVIDGMFYLYYTAQDVDNRSLNRLYLSKIDFYTLINQLQ